MDSISFGARGGSRRWNRHVDRMQRAQLVLRISDEGRAAITEMIDDPVRTVAHWSAAQALSWAPSLARPFLEADAATPGLDGLNARTTLSAFDAGRLRMDWEPKRDSAPLRVQPNLRVSSRTMDGSGSFPLATASTQSTASSER